MAGPRTIKVRARKTPVSKRTSQSIYVRPKNRHERKNWKKYRGQG